MWSKLYLAILGLSIAAMAFFTYYSWSWLQSIGQPAAAVVGYEYNSGVACTALIISGVLLLLLANGVLWATKRAWAMWATFVYVGIFVIIRYFWLGEAFFRFKKDNRMSDGSFSLGPVMGVILVVALGVVVFANQFASVRLNRKMYPPIASVEIESDSETESKTEVESKAE